jgi:hypothetical protein
MGGEKDRRKREADAERLDTILLNLRTFFGLWARRIAEEVFKLTGQFSFMLLHSLIIEPEIISRITMLKDFVLIFLFD